MVYQRTQQVSHTSLPETKSAREPSQPAETSKLYTLEDVDPIGRWEGCIVGGRGQGKTVCASTFPSPFRWIAADGDTCLKSIRWAFKEGKTSLKSAKDLVAYSPTEDIPEDSHYAKNPSAFDKVTDMIDHWFSSADLANWEGGSLVIDTLSLVNDWGMNKALGINGKFPSETKALSSSHKINNEAKLRIIQGKQDYKSCNALVQGFVDDVRLLCAKNNRNLILLCSEWIDDEADDQGNRRVLKVKPNLTGQLRDSLIAPLDDVWFAHAYSNGDFKVQVHADPVHDAKTRWGGFLKREEKADYRYLIQKVKDYHEMDAEKFKKAYA